MLRSSFFIALVFNETVLVLEKRQSSTSTAGAAYEG